MALWTIKNVRIAGVSAAFPKSIKETHDFEFFNNEEAETFNNTVGINRRRIASPEICASDLCQTAGERLITELGWDKNSIDILIFESITPDYKTPPTSCVLQGKMNLSERCFCLDMPMGCCGFIYAVTVAGKLMQSGETKRALLLIGDTTYRTSSPRDKSRAPLFGDGGTAVALEFDTDASDIIVEIETLGKDYEAIMTPHGGFRSPVAPSSFEFQDFGNGVVRAPIHALINGMNVYSFAISKPPKSILKFINSQNIEKKDIDYFLIHQANNLIIERIIKKLDLPRENVPKNLEEYGNLGGASIPALMVTRLRKQLSAGGYTIIASSFGLGLTWGTCVLKTNSITIPEVIYI